MTTRAGAFALLAALSLTAGAAASPWSEVPGPSAGPPHVIGEAARGCLAGAAMLPTEGPGFQVIHLSRRRNFSHPQTIDFVERLGRTAAASGLAPFYVGDMSLPRGGPMPNGHASHQSGVDVDIWFNLDPKPDLAPAAREDVPLPTMVNADQTAIDPARFGRRQVTLLRLAASDPRVDRIFVNRAIKRALCEGVGGANASDRSWRHRIRRGTATTSTSMSAWPARRARPIACARRRCRQGTGATPRSTGGSSRIRRRRPGRRSPGLPCRLSARPCWTARELVPAEDVRDLRLARGARFRPVVLGEDGIDGGQHEQREQRADRHARYDDEADREAA